VKLSIPCLVALLSLVLAGEVRAQVAADSHNAGAPASPSISVSQSTAARVMPLDEIARRLIRQANQIDCYLPGLGGLAGIGEPTSKKCDSSSVPTRVTFESVQVNSQGTDNYVVDAKFTVRGYYRDSTTVNDKDQRLLLFKESGGWSIQTDSAKFISGRSEPKSAAPAPGESDVPAGTLASPQAGIARAAENGAGEPVVLGRYSCVASSGGQLVHVGGFTLEAGGAYHDEGNARGTYTYDANQHQITFAGAAMGGQSARYAGGTFTVKSARNSVDCDRDR
jgi:hypothetical protein